MEEYGNSSRAQTSDFGHPIYSRKQVFWWWITDTFLIDEALTILLI